MREKTTEVDPVKNRIVIYFDGFMTLEEAQMLKEQAKAMQDEIKSINERVKEIESAAKKSK